MDRNITGIFTGDWEKAVVPYVGTWIEIALLPQQSALQLCRSLRGNVDRNSELVSARLYTLVVPYVGTWIEMQSIPETNWALTVVPYVGTWIEMV